MHEISIFVYIFGMAKTTPATHSPLLHAALKLFDYLPDVALFVKNVRSEFVYANPEFLTMTRVKSLAELAGKTDRDFSPRELADRFIRDDRQVMRSGKPIESRVELVQNFDNSISWHITTKVPIRNSRGLVIGLAGITRDLNRATITVGRYKEMSEVMRYLESHYPETIEMPTLATIAHLSLSQFERRFKALFQTTPHNYLIRLRLNKASQMLTSSTTKITEIASQCGFYDHSHFIRQFTRSYGISPAAYRRQPGHH